MVSSKSIIYKEYCEEGLPEDGKHWILESKEIDCDNIPDGAIALQTHYLSVDPYLRGRMREKKSPLQKYPIPFPLNQPVVSHGVAKVTKSKNPNFKEGDIVVGIMNWSEHSVIQGDWLKQLHKVPLEYGLDIHLFVGGLGMPGLTAYIGLEDIGKPKEGETIFVSGAAGAVGQLVGQLAKLKGLRVIGSCGDDEKCRYLREDLGFDVVFNYKKENVAEALKKHAPDGIDIYWDNVGGETLDAAFGAGRNNARFIECGMISGYNQGGSGLGSTGNQFKNIMNIVTRRYHVEGFIVSDKESQYKESFIKEVAPAMKAGKIKYREHINKGLENATSTFTGMLRGTNFGKALVEVSKP